MRYCLYALLGWLLLGCGTQDEAAPTTLATDLPAPVFPTTDWARRSPDSVGIDPVVLDAALQFLAGHCKADGLEETLVIRRGYLVWAGDSIRKVHDIWSCTKSFTSMAAGLLQAEGAIALDDRAATYEPSLREHYPEATIRQFLTMTSGYDAVGDSRWGEPSEDWSRTPYVPAAPLFAPGSAYAYWDEAMIMLGKVLTRASGQSLNDYLDERIFQAIGIQRREWWGEGELADGTRLNFGGTGLKMSAAEHARFGLLILNRGRWGAQQLLPADYVTAATRNQVPETLALADTDRRGTDGRGRYGYNWWVINQGAEAPVAAAYTSGLHHNVCLVIPAWEMVIVRMGTDGNPEAGKQAVYTELLQRLAPGIR